MLTAIITLSAATLCSSPARACVCVPRPPLVTEAAMREQLTHVDAAFEGRVTSVTFRSDSTILPDGHVWRELLLVATVQVDRSWQGANSPELTVVTPAHATACGADLRQGQAYIFFASREPNGDFAVTSCNAPQRTEDGAPLRLLLEQVRP
jgi:hypothetical protein